MISTITAKAILRKNAKIRNQYNQVPHLTQDTERKHHLQESQEVGPFTTCDHKAARNRHHGMTKTNTRNKNIHKRTAVLECSVRKLLEGLNKFHRTNLTLNSDVDQDT